MEIDAKKLARIIKEEFEYQESMGCTESQFCIGEIEGRQIQIKVVSDEDEFCSNKESLRCIKG